MKQRLRKARQGRTAKLVRRIPVSVPSALLVSPTAAWQSYVPLPLFASVVRVAFESSITLHSQEIVAARNGSA
jgi:hypothetical protein